MISYEIGRPKSAIGVHGFLSKSEALTNCPSTTIQNWKSKRILYGFWGPRANSGDRFKTKSLSFSFLGGAGGHFSAQNCKHFQFQYVPTPPCKLDSFSLNVFLGWGVSFFFRQGTHSKRYATFAVELVWLHPSTTWYTSNRLGVACQLVGAKPGKSQRVMKNFRETHHPKNATISPQQKCYGRILRDYEKSPHPEK